VKTKNQKAAPALPTAAPNIPCMKAKPNTAKIQDRAKQKRLRKMFAPLRFALERTSTPVKWSGTPAVTHSFADGLPRASDGIAGQNFYASAPTTTYLVDSTRAVN
jgi:hypothetical protein